MNIIPPLVFALYFTTDPVVVSGEGGCSLSNKNKLVKMRRLSRFIFPILPRGNFKKMSNSLLIRIVSFSLSLLVILSPAAVNADEKDSSLIDSDPSETVQAPRHMTEKQMNDLFGEDPYLGQTSYLQSPDGFSQRDKSK